MKTLVIMSASLLTLFGLGNGAHGLSVGDDAPQLSARDQNGTEIKLSEVYAKGPTLIYFYPKADTPGCTAQACSLRDGFPQFQGEGVQVLGVSVDTVEAQKKFADKYKLPFTLLADPDGTLVKAFGVPTFPVVGLAKRQSFLVKDGKIAWVVTSAKTAEHAAEVQEALRSLGLAKKP